MRYLLAGALLCCCSIVMAGSEPDLDTPLDQIKPLPPLSLAPTDIQYLDTSPRTWGAHASYAVGYKRMSSKWEPARDQLQYGIADADFRPPNFPFSFAAQVLGTYSDNVPNINGVTGDFSSTYEFNIGLRKIFFEHKSPIQPFISGGLSVLGASTTTDHNINNTNQFVREDSDAGIGYWASVGVYWHFLEHWHVGVQGEYSYGTVKLFGDKLNAGGWNAMFLFGYDW